MSDVKWNPLIDAIRNNKCILCIGPEIFSDSSEESLEKKIEKYLNANLVLDNDIIPYPDGLFHFRKKRKRSNVLSELDRFYQGSFPFTDKIYKLLVELPFSLILVLTPDERFVAISKELGFNITSDFYFKNHPPSQKKSASLDFPVAYNLLGSFKNTESIVITHDDLFDFIQSIFRGKSMAEGNRLMIRNAEHFICLGLPFEKWYMQLLLRVLSMHTNTMLTNYAANNKELDKKIVSKFEDQFDITFVNDNILSFCEKLSEKCKLENLIRTKITNADSKNTSIRSLVAKDKLSEAIKVLKKSIFSEQNPKESLEDQIVILERNHNFMEDQQFKGIIDFDKYKQERNSVATKLLELDKKIRNQ